MKRIWEKIKACWSVMRYDLVLVVTRKGEKTKTFAILYEHLKSENAEFVLDSEKYAYTLAFKAKITDEIQEILKNRIENAEKELIKEEQKEEVKGNVKTKNTTKRKARKPKTVKKEPEQ